MKNKTNVNCPVVLRDFSLSSLLQKSALQQSLKLTRTFYVDEL